MILCGDSRNDVRQSFVSWQNEIDKSKENSPVIEKVKKFYHRYDIMNVWFSFKVPAKANDSVSYDF
jgi:hypothetical protein